MKDNEFITFNDAKSKFNGFLANLVVTGVINEALYGIIYSNFESCLDALESNKDCKSFFKIRDKFSNNYLCKDGTWGNFTLGVSFSTVDELVAFIESSRNGQPYGDFLLYNVPIENIVITEYILVGDKGYLDYKYSDLKDCIE